ncbi:MAG: sulfite exporter TauE/SafE family protein [Chloroflexota bacterium]
MSAVPPPGADGDGSGARARAEALRRRTGMSPRTFAASVLLPLACAVVIVATLALAPADDRSTIVWATVVAIASGVAATSIGVYGGVLVPGLLLLGIDPRFAAAASLFLQVLVIPLGASAHYKLGNVTRRVAVPLIVGGMAGAFIGPFFAVALPKETSARIVSGVIILVGLLVLATLRWGGLRSVLPIDRVSRLRIGGVGLTAGFASGVSGAGWGPIGVKLLILLRIEPRIAIGSSLVGRVFMAGAAVVGYLVSATAFRDVAIDLYLLAPMLAGSVAAMVPGAFLVTKLGRETATIGITLLSIGLAIPTFVFGV